MLPRSNMRALHWSITWRLPFGSWQWRRCGRKNTRPIHRDCAGLYASGTLEEAESWAVFFAEIGRPTYSIVKIQVDGHSFCGNAERCFDGSADRCSNRRLAEQYWENPYDGSGICEMLVDGEIEVVEIVKEINANLPEDAE